MNQDHVKQALLEIIEKDAKKGKRWFFPKNVDHQYKVFGNMTLKEISYFILPSLLLSAGIAFVPPYNSVLFWLFKAVCIIFVITLPVVYINYRPVKYRDNIRSKDFLRELIEYRKKKKVYFVKPKDKLID